MKKLNFYVPGTFFLLLFHSNDEVRSENNYLCKECYIPRPHDKTNSWNRFEVEVVGSSYFFEYLIYIFKKIFKV